ncbi:hypothetical protein L226DRAFT_533358 [Lentinus tigrinus ALCF2SS1-7]|uniref:Uncharacterized protein n=1 Tax=Lentinus tigrinus ALCF2SS1-6 TaxID=1328759 RepID=A0A5C2SK85_9APHY|nr:hypothetical protein L227DRAFT_316069 [Lentinus tigrinus ALCF2SS1-6]RPD76242.1 hypothetical protein L226DRAFT_533358 [Lentinus tigrinus ALCF2SS1-7]
MNEAGPSNRRQPKAMYHNHNGFTQQVDIKMSGLGFAQSSQVNLHAIAANPKKTSKAERQELYDALQRRQVVEDMMELQGTFFPGLEVIKRTNEEPETSEALKERMQELQKKHTEEVRTLYEWHAQDYYDEMLDMSRSQNDCGDPDTEAFYQRSRSCYDIATSFDDELDRHHHAYLNTMISLVQQSNLFRARAEAAKKWRDKQFPATITAFHNNPNKEVQLRVAKFLTLDDVGQDRYLTEFGWTWRQVTPLIKEYKQNHTFQSEVQRLLRDLEARDPRRRD